MAIWLIEGRLGSGKGKWGIWKIEQYLSEGRRVVTNVDVFLDKLARPMSKRTLIRIPDYPTVGDLEAIGHGNPETYDEDRNGLIVIDELAKFLNSRDYANPSRRAVIDWLIESRKAGWDVMFMAQAGLQIDRQIREALVEYSVTCFRLDKVRIPFGVGWLIENLSLGKLKGTLPRMHMAVVRLAAGGRGGMVLDRFMYRRDELHAAYDTRQRFRDWRDPEVMKSETRIGPHSMLSAWHLVGRYQVASVPFWRSFFSRAKPPAKLARGPGLYAQYPALAKLPPEVAWELVKAKVEGRPFPRPSTLLHHLVNVRHAGVPLPVPPGTVNTSKFIQVVKPAPAYLEAGQGGAL